jgi:hypothetical protein
VNSELRDRLLDIAATALEDREFPSWLDESTDWQELFDAAAAHGLLPLALRAYKRSNGHAEPERSPAQDRVLVAARYMLLLHRFRQIVDTLRSAGIPAIALKGPLLAETIYPDPLLRPFSDLDILCRESDWTAAHNVLIKLGFTLTEGLPSPPAKP